MLWWYNWISLNKPEGADVVRATRWVRRHCLSQQKFNSHPKVRPLSIFVNLPQEDRIQSKCNLLFLLHLKAHYRLSIPVCMYAAQLYNLHLSADCAGDAQHMAEKKPQCFCGNCITRLVHRLSDWATSQYGIFYEKCFLLHESWCISLFGCPCNDSWISVIRTALSGDVVCRSADMLNCTANVVAIWAQAMTDGQVRTRDKKNAQRACTVVVSLSLWVTCKDSVSIRSIGLIQASIGSPSVVWSKMSRGIWHRWDRQLVNHCSSKHTLKYLNEIPSLLSVQRNRSSPY